MVNANAEIKVAEEYRKSLEHQDAEHRAKGREPERRQPAEGLGGEVVVCQARTC